MDTLTTHQAKTHLSRYLAEVEKGKSFTIARGRQPVAHLVPAAKKPVLRRPKVGDIEGPVFHFNKAAFAPLSEQELGEWGL